MDLGNKKYLFEDGHFLSFIRESVGIHLVELSKESNVPYAELLAFEDGFTGYLDEFNVIRRQYLNSLISVSKSKNINITDKIEKYADLGSVLVYL